MAHLDFHQRHVRGVDLANGGELFSFAWEGRGITCLQAWAPLSELLAYQVLCTTTCEHSGCIKQHLYKEQVLHNLASHKRVHTACQRRLRVEWLDQVEILLMGNISPFALSLI